MMNKKDKKADVKNTSAFLWKVIIKRLSMLYNS